jgi:hypothetical protein
MDRLLTRGVASAQAGQRAEAYNLLLDVIELDRHNEQAWLWLSTVANHREDQRICLENVLTINPDNTFAQERLGALSANGNQRGDVSPKVLICPRCGAGNRDFVRVCGACGYVFFHPCAACGEYNPSDARTCDHCGSLLTPPQSPGAWSSQQPTPVIDGGPATSRPLIPITLWPVVAFWVGVSIFFVGGGMVSLYQFTGNVLRARGVLQNLKPIEVAWLPMGLFFILFGLTGIGLALQLAHRRPGGYYGSLIFGLVLALLGPSVGLVLEPPDYVATVCTGLMPAAVILFTLASIAGFESSFNQP